MRVRTRSTSWTSTFATTVPIPVGRDRATAFLPTIPGTSRMEHVVSDNHIHDIGLVFPPAVGVWVGQSSRNVIAHNHIHDLYYTGISVGWTRSSMPAFVRRVMPRSLIR